MPVVVKSTALRGQVQSVENTTIVGSRDELLNLPGLAGTVRDADSGVHPR